MYCNFVVAYELTHINKCSYDVIWLDHLKRERFLTPEGGGVRWDFLALLKMAENMHMQELYDYLCIVCNSTVILVPDNWQKHVEGSELKISKCI